jgi:hypothetical protein
MTFSSSAVELIRGWRVPIGGRSRCQDPSKRGMVILRRVFLQETKRGPSNAVGLPTFVSAFGNLIDRQNRAHQEAQLPETSSDDQTVDDVQALFTTPLGLVECLHPL